MKTKHLLISVLLMLLSASAYAQGENNVWCFGNHLGLDFNGGGPIPFTDSCSAVEGTASISTATGSLLFYCDGKNVYDKTHTIMTNGDSIAGNPSTTQGIAIASFPGSDSLFYLFTLKDVTDSGKLYYSIIDISLRSGLGDIIAGYKNIFVDSQFSEKMIIAGFCDKQWLILHHKDSGIFYSYNLTTFPGVAVKSYTGNHKLYKAYGVGEMKVSADYTQIALANHFLTGSVNQSFELYDLNINSGIIWNFRTIDSFSKGFAYGIDFSPDGSKLYISGTEAHGVYQYDLSLPTLAAIRLSKYTVTSEHTYGFRLGPDKMLYFSSPKYSNFSRIRKPDLKGLLCDFEPNFLLTSAPGAGAGLGNQFIKRGISGSTDTTIYSRTINFCEGESKKITKPGYNTYYWNDGDTTSYKTFHSSGLYWLVTTSNCGVNVDTFHINRIPLDTTYSIRLDTTLCDGETMTVSMSTDREWYKWSDGDSLKFKKLTSPSKLSVLSKLGCSFKSDTFKINAILIDTIHSILVDTLLCSKDVLKFAKPSSFREWFKWADGDTSSIRALPSPSSQVIISKKGCDYYFDSLIIRELKPELHIYSSYKKICQGSSVVINSGLTMGKYKWYDGDTNQIKTIKTGAGIYWVEAEKDCKIFIDTITITEQHYAVTNNTIDTIICFSNSVNMRAPDTFQTYLWNGGNTGFDTTLYTNGRVIVVAKDTIHCTILKQDYTVSFVNFSSNIPDTSTCNEDTIILDATIPNPAATYRWNVGDTTAKLKVTSGSRYVFIAVNGCTLIDSVNVKQFPMKVNIGEDTSLCKGTKTILKADVDNVSYKWSTGATSQSIEVSESGNYGVTIFKDACSGKSEVNISFVNCDNCTAFPSGFTPNNDGINDYFKPILNCPPVSYQLKILNRWGQEVYTSSNPNDKWDGTSKGNALDGGVYFYMLKVKFEAQNDEEKMFKGEITLLR